MREENTEKMKHQDHNMNLSLSIESLANLVAEMSKHELIDRLLHYDGRPRLDFTESYLKGQSDEKLRHILFAALSTRAKAG